ncbi:unnamed protein product [Chrysoparadoxa australica]
MLSLNSCSSLVGLDSLEEIGERDGDSYPSLLIEMSEPRSVLPGGYDGELAAFFGPWATENEVGSQGEPMSSEQPKEPKLELPTIKEESWHEPSTSVLSAAVIPEERHEVVSRPSCAVTLPNPTVVKPEAIARAPKWQLPAKKGTKRPQHAVLDEELVERRSRNREHAAKCRMRLKVKLDTLEDHLMVLRRENMRLRQIAREWMPERAEKVISDSEGSGTGEDDEIRPGVPSAIKLIEQDFQLVKSVEANQQNMILTDRSKPGNPIIHVCQGFLKLTGYTRNQLIGQSWKILVGEKTEQASLNIMTQAIENGRDATLCLLCYQANGKPFWNQLYIGSLHDNTGAVVHNIFVSIQVPSSVPGQFKKQLRRLPIPPPLMESDGEDANETSHGTTKRAAKRRRTR